MYGHKCDNSFNFCRLVLLDLYRNVVFTLLAHHYHNYNYSTERHSCIEFDFKTEETV